MRTLLHIGMTKTGSTALQQSLRRSHAALRARGVLYPLDPARPDSINHKLILAGLFDWRGSRSGLLPAAERPPSRAPDCARFFADLRATIAAAPPRCLILSTESLFRILPAAAPARLPGLLAGLTADLAVVAYLRRPAEHYLSRLQQHLKAAHAPPQPSPPRYRAVLEQYATIFGAEALALGVFHRTTLAEGDVVADFAARRLAPYGVTRADLAAPVETNATLSAESVDISRRFRLAFHRDRDHRFTPDSTRLVAALRAADAATGAPRPRLRPGIAERVDAAQPDPLWLRDRHGIVFPEFDYARLEAGRPPPPEGDLALEDIIEIDRGRERAILAALRAAPWAAKPARRAWIDALAAELA